MSLSAQFLASPTAANARTNTARMAHARRTRWSAYRLALAYQEFDATLFS